MREDSLQHDRHDRLRAAVVGRVTRMAAQTQLVDVFRYGSALIDPPSRPWRLGAWTWATQGHFLVALQDDGAETDPTPESKLKAQRYLDTKPVDLTPIAVSALVAFAGLVSSPVECDDCHGTGYETFGALVKCEHCGATTRRECESCGGDGRRGTPPIRYGRIAGVPLNLALLAYALTCVPQEETCEVGMIEASSTGSGVTLLVIGRTWRIAVMSVRDPTGVVPALTLERPPSVNAVDPSAQPTGNLTPRA